MKYGGFYVRAFCTGILLLFCSNSYGQVSVKIKGTNNLPVCTKPANPLAEGNRIGALKRGVNGTVVYQGPSVICPHQGKIDKAQQFVVSGQQFSTWGKHWFYIELENNRSANGWVPAKYLSLGQKVSDQVTSSPNAVSQPKVNYDSESISETPVSPTIDLNVRDCPDTSCSQVTTVSKNNQYTATKLADNGWYYVEAASSRFGWISGKYVTVEEIQPTPIVQPLAAYTTPTAIEPTVTQFAEKTDPCTIIVRTRVRNRITLWKTNSDFYVRKSAHKDCVGDREIQLGQGVISVGDANRLTEVLYLEEGQLQKGYLDRRLETNYITELEVLPKSFNRSQAQSIISAREAYWQSYRYKIDRWWKNVKQYYKTHTFHLILTVVFLLGLFLLFPRPSRQMMLRLDQKLLRIFYFAIRSRHFWRFIRKIIFIFIVVAALVALSFVHGMWLANVADLRQKFMGVASVLLISLSLGWFGLRVLAFFVGVLLLFLTYIEFFFFVITTALVFVLPSLLLVWLYYLRYQRKPIPTEMEKKAHFDSEKIERLHDQMFKLRNFYPETVISWVRNGTFKENFRKAAEVIKARTDYFNGFFEFAENPQGNPG